MNPFFRSFLSLLMSVGLLGCVVAAGMSQATYTTNSREVMKVVFALWAVGTGCCVVSYLFLKPSNWWIYAIIWALLSVPSLFMSWDAFLPR